MPRSFWIDTAQRRLWDDRGEVQIAPKPLDVLCMLVDHPREIVSREDLERAVWTDVRVTESALRYAIRQLRRALGDAAGRPVFVETIPRRGWRLVAPLSRTPTPGVKRLDPAGARLPGGRRDGAASRSPVIAGREHELETLVAALDRARGGTPTLVFVSGEAGIGKTTLIGEFLRRSSQLPDLAVATAECVQHYGSEEPFLPTIEALERLANVVGGEHAAAVLRRYAPSWLAELPSLTAPEERPHLVPQAVGATVARMLREFGAALENLCIDRTIVLSFDDVHWSDAASLELLAALVRRRKPLRLLLIATLRPAEVAARPGPLATTRRDLQIHDLCTEVLLEGLSQAAVAEYLEGRFGATTDAAARARMTEFVHQWTEGNPLFMVSVVDQLVARGVIRDGSASVELRALPHALRAPTTVRKLIEEELDRIDPEHRAMLETASLAGMEFSAAAVAAGSRTGVESVEACCQRLCRSGRFLRATGEETWPDGTIASRYRFGHALYREILSEALPAARRARIHRDIGLRRESAWGEHASAIAAELAHHFEQAGDSERAMRYFATAGDGAARRFANREAAAYLRRALRLLRAQPPGAERDAIELVLLLAASAPLAATEGYASPELAENLARVQALADLSDTNEAVFPVLLALWSLHIVRADLSTARHVGNRLLAGARATSEPVLRLQANRVVGHTLFYAGDLVGARRHLTAALDGYDVANHTSLDYSYGDDPVVLCLSYVSWVHWFQGHADQAVQSVELASETADDLGHPPSRAFALSYAAVLHQLRHDPPAAERTADALLALAEEEALPLWHALARIVRGWAWAAAGDGEAGIIELRHGLDGWEATGADLGRPHFLGLLAQAYGRLGRIDEGLALLATAGEVIERTGQHVFSPECLRLEGELLAAKGDPQAAARIRQAIGVARRQGARALTLRGSVSLCRLPLPTTERREALRALARRRRTLHEGLDTADLREADALLA